MLEVSRSDRFRAKYRVEDSGCWTWLAASVPPYGYGVFWSGGPRGVGRQVYAHRWIYEQRSGPIPDGYQIDHLCRNPRCVNVEHLEAVPPKVNNARSESSSAKKGRQDACGRGHPFDAENTIRTKGGRRRCHTCLLAWRRARHGWKGYVGQGWGAAKTHCVNGHEFTPENTHLSRRGRNCRECHRVRERERWRRLHGFHRKNQLRNAASAT